MIAELGHFAMALALVLALVQGTVPLVGAARRNPGWMAVGPAAANAQLLAIGVAFAALLHAYVTSDFSVAAVARNSHTAKPLLYKITGVWGNHEGSLLLWVAVLALFGASVAWFGGALPAGLKARVLAVQGLIAVGFLAFLLFASNPFERLWPAPWEGDGLNPLLQDPGLAFHPPLLYLGYVGLSVTFSFAIAALLEGRVDAAWARWVRPWTLAAWICLTGGIALGSWWAYYELGWGGYWFWDPVENASLMPWLAATALLHSAIVVEKRDALKRWTVLLAIIAFGLSLIGTFLVRSGIITSVHAFASDPTRGLFILVLLAIALGAAFTLYAWRAAILEPGGLFRPVSREGALVLNNLFLSAAVATVLLGTLYPLFLDAMGGGAVSVGPPYFNSTVVPLLGPLVASMAVGPLLGWKRADLGGALGRLKFAALAAAAAALLAFWLSAGGPVLAVAGFALAAWAIGGAITELADRVRWRLSRLAGIPRAAFGTAFAHAGLGVTILGLSGMMWQAEGIAALAPGQSMEIAGYRLTLERVGPVPGPNYQAQRAEIRVEGHGESVIVTPEKRRFSDPPMVTTEAAIRSSGIADLYIVLGEADASGRFAVRAYRNPLAPFIWGGALVMALGGLVSLSDRRLRLGVARRAAAAKAAGGGAAVGT